MILRTGMGQAVLSPVDWARITGNPAPQTLPTDIAASIYESAEYGTIPRLSTSTTGTPAPAAPPEGSDPRLWTPEQAAKIGQENYNKAISDYIAAQESSGAYNPEGNLPMSATDLNDLFSNYGWWIAGGAVLLIGLVLLSKAR